MLDLSEIPFFAALSPESLARVRADIPVKHYTHGTIIARVGEPGRYFQAVAAGAVRVQPEASASGWRGLILGPGQVFGEMSLFTGMPVSATLVAVRDTTTYCLDGDAFLRLLDKEPELHRSLTRLLIDRLRHHTRNESRAPGLAVLTCPDRGFDILQFAKVVAEGVRYYAPGSELTDVNSRDPRKGGLDVELIDRWRESATGGQFLVTVVKPETLRAFANILQPEDVVLEVMIAENENDSTVTTRTLAGAANFNRVYVGPKPPRDIHRWAFGVPVAELTRAGQSTGQWSRGAAPNLDHIARYITFSEIGVALSSGAARGFAHVGVLEALEEHNIPVDYLCGTSMGGITALTVANAASAREGALKMREFLGGNHKIKDRSWWPRSSVYAGERVARAARQVFGDATFADLRIPTAVVASDLATGDRAVIDSGLVVPAVLGTSSIPGFLPPITLGARLLVDGAIVSRVPVDVLDRRRCGLRIAVNVVAPPNDDDSYRRHRQSLLVKRTASFLGFRSVLGASWELLGSYGSNLEALRADIVITPDTHRRGGGPFDFDHVEAMIDCGHQATVARMDAIRDTVRAMLRAGHR
jgi:NTE family protein